MNIWPTHGRWSRREKDMIMLSPEMNEPVLNSYYEENLRGIDNSIADLQKTLDKTGTRKPANRCKRIWIP